MRGVGSDSSGSSAPCRGDRRRSKSRNHRRRSTTASTSPIQQNNRNSGSTSGSALDILDTSPRARLHDTKITQQRHLGKSLPRYSHSSMVEHGDCRPDEYDGKCSRSIPRGRSAVSAQPRQSRPSAPTATVTSRPATSSTSSLSPSQQQKLYRKCSPKVFPELLYDMLTAASTHPTPTATAAAAQSITKDHLNEKNEEEEEDEKEKEDGEGGHDHDDDDQSESTSNTGKSISSSNKIYGFEDIISWQPHGRCFLVHKKSEFVRNIMPRFFHQTKLTSFQRQLNLYGFVRLNAGLDKGGYYHELFLRGRPELCPRIHRQKIKGHGCKVVPPPGSEPNFYAMEVCYDAGATPTCTAANGSNNEHGDQIGSPIDDDGVKDAKGSKIVVDVAPAKEETTHGASRLTADGFNEMLDAAQHDDDNDMDDVSVELMAMGDDDDNDLRENGRDELLLDPDDQIEKDSLAQIECDMVLYGDTANDSAMSIDSITGPVIVTPHASSDQQHGPHSLLTLPEDGPQRWSIPLLQKTPPSRWTTSSDATSCFLKPSVAQSSAPASSTWSLRDRQLFLQRQIDGMGCDSDHRSPTDPVEASRRSRLRDGDEVWFDDGHRFCFVAPNKLAQPPASRPPPQEYVSAAGWVRSSAARVPTGGDNIRDTSDLMRQIADACDMCGDLTTTTVDRSATAHYHPSLSYSMAVRRGSVPMDRLPASMLLAWPSSVAGRRLLQQSLSPPSQMIMTQRTTTRGRMVDVRQLPDTSSIPTANSGRQPSQQQLPSSQPFWDGRRVSL